ncbi:MAG: ABC transporter permease [Phototrophicaceae bacterium]|jgi:ribose/xylose/arabinose/galactoside ABC-type transport system permease subunit
MTTTTQQPLKVTPVTFARSPRTLIPLLLGALMLAAYSLLPFIQQPELGATTVPLLTESRGNNELEVETNGLRLLWFAGFSVLLLGVANVADPRLERVLSVLTALAGVLGLVYYIVFWQDYRATEATYFSQVGLAFWAMLALALLMVGQLALPRPPAPRMFEPARLLGNQESILLLALVALLVIVGISNPRYLAERNLLDLLQGNAYVAVAAIGMSMVIITGNIDISVGSLITLLAVICGRLAVAGLPIPLAWAAPLVVGVIIGAGIGLLVAYLRVPSIVVTLAMLSILKGILIIWTGGERVVDLPEAFKLAQWNWFGVAVPIWFMLILTPLALLWMRYSTLGRSFYAVGGNKEAARLSGINERVVVLQAFMLNGLFAGVAGLIYATQFQLIQPTPPPFLELNIITAAVIGGVSILGGTGTVLGATLAAILLNSIRSGMVFINVDPFWLKSVQGLLILGTVLADLFRRNRQRAR